MKTFCTPTNIFHQILGAYPIQDYPSKLIDIHHINELRNCEYNENLEVGAGLTMTELMDILKTGAEQEGFEYLTKLYDHMDLVAHIPLRNVSTPFFIILSRFL